VVRVHVERDKGGPLGPPWERQSLHAAGAAADQEFQDQFDPWAADLTAINSVVTRTTALTTLVNQIRSDLVTIGVLKGSN
jgi:hypothetical protein